MTLFHLFLSSQSSQVEGQFFTFQDVTVTSTGLTWSGRDTSVQSTSTKLRFDSVFDLGVSRSSSPLSFSVSRLSDSFFFSTLNVLLLTQGLTVVSFVPLLEWSSIDLDNSSLGQGVGSNQFIVRWMVDDTSNSGLSGDTFCKETIMANNISRYNY